MTDEYEKEMTDIIEQMRRSIMNRIDYSKAVTDSDVYELIDMEIFMSEHYMIRYMSPDNRVAIRQMLFDSIRRLDILQSLIEDPAVTEIMVNGPDDIFYESSGELHRYEGAFSSKEKLSDIIQQIVGESNRVVNTASPIVDCRLSNGDRVNVVLAPVAVNGPILTIRRFPAKPITMSDLIGYGSIPEEVASFLGRCVRAKLNIFISGGTGSGKTTFLNTLSEFIGPAERVVTIEDNAELQIRGVPNLVRLEARNAGEVRGPEAIDMVQALNTGHDGSMSTGHANSGYDGLSRLETMILMGMELPIQAVRGQLASGLDLIVHLSRLRDRSRKVMEISEVVGIKDGQILLSTLYRFRETGETDGKIEGIWEKENDITNTVKFEMAGIPL